MNSGGIKIHSDYAGGNIKVISIEDNLIKVEQDLRDSDWWFYWNFCVENAQGKELVFEFMNIEVVGLWGPAMSKDNSSWEWAGEESFISHKEFRYRFGSEDKKVYFSFSIPYLVKHFEDFYSQYQGHEYLRRKILTDSEKGRSVPLLEVGEPNANKHIVFTCRHHACESTASYMLEGLLSYFLSQKESPVLKNYLIHVVPFVDIDGVEEGDQGKARKPHDHNRDYIEKPIYKSTSAIMDYFKDYTPEVAIDFHSPGKWGVQNDYPFFVMQYSPIKEEIEKLAEFLLVTTSKNGNADKILFRKGYDIEAGSEWNNTDHPTCSTFFRSLNTKLCFSYEFPYFGIGDAVVTAKNSREFGKDFAKALELYLID